MNISQENTLDPDNANGGLGNIIDIVRPAENPIENAAVEQPRSHGLVRFIVELRRRRVCRAITMYSIAMWLVCQIVELVTPELGLPEWTLRFFIMIGLLGLAIALILSWLIDITPDGLVLESASRPNHPSTKEAEPRRPFDQIIDCSLVLVALIIGAQLAVGVLSTESNAAPTSSQKIAVVPFRVASGNEAGTLSQGLVIELQHELVRQSHVTVIASRDPYLVTDSLSLTGAVAVGEQTVRITATMIDNSTGAITWSAVFERPRTNSLIAPVEFAQEIVAALPLQLQVTSAPQADHAT